MIPEERMTKYQIIMRLKLMIDDLEMIVEDMEASK